MPDAQVNSIQSYHKVLFGTPLKLRTCPALLADGIVGHNAKETVYFLSLGYAGATEGYKVKSIDSLSLRLNPS